MILLGFFGFFLIKLSETVLVSNRIIKILFISHVMLEQEEDDEIRLSSLCSGFNRSLTGPFSSEDGEVLYFASGSAIHTMAMETGNLLDLHILGGHLPGSTISSVRHVPSSSSSSSDEKTAMRILTAGSDNRIICWEVSEESGKRSLAAVSCMDLDLMESRSDGQKAPLHKGQSYLFDAIKPSSTKDEIYIVVSSPWRHSASALVGVDKSSAKAKKSEAEFKLLLLDTASMRISRKVCNLRNLACKVSVFQTGKSGRASPSHEFLVCASRRKLVSWSAENKVRANQPRRHSMDCTLISLPIYVADDDLCVCFGCACAVCVCAGCVCPSMSPTTTSSAGQESCARRTAAPSLL